VGGLVALKVGITTNLTWLELRRWAKHLHGYRL
jgi:hypothetical protein